MEIKCQYCGELIDSRGYSSHLISAKCRIAQTWYAVERQHLERCGHFSQVLRAADIKVSRLLTHYSPGYIGRRAAYYYSDFAPREAVILYHVLKGRKFKRDEVISFFRSEAGKTVLEAIRTLLELQVPETTLWKTAREMVTLALRGLEIVSGRGRR